MRSGPTARVVRREAAKFLWLHGKPEDNASSRPHSPARAEKPVADPHSASVGNRRLRIIRGSAAHRPEAATDRRAPHIVERGCPKKARQRHPPPHRLVAAAGKFAENISRQAPQAEQHGCGGRDRVEPLSQSMSVSGRTPRFTRVQPCTATPPRRARAGHRRAIGGDETGDDQRGGPSAASGPRCRTAATRAPTGWPTPPHDARRKEPVPTRQRYSSPPIRPRIACGNRTRPSAV